MERRTDMPMQQLLHAYSRKKENENPWFPDVY
jgi:hypothetical protein